MNQQYGKRFLFFELSFPATLAVEIIKSRYELSAIILANSTDVIILALDCRHDSRKTKKAGYELQTKILAHDMNRRPISQSRIVLIKI